MPNDRAPRPGGETATTSTPPTSRARAFAVVVVLVAAGATWWWSAHRHPAPPGAPAGGPGEARGGPGRRTVPAVIDTVKAGEVPVVVRAVGTVTARTTTVVRARVDGLLERIAFREGQSVKRGDTLALIDPKPFAVQVQSALGQLAKDRAQLESARVDLARYRTLIEQEGVSRQQLDAQQALVKQLEGVVETDSAQVATARLNLGYTKVVAPVTGRVGLRQVDPGNMVHGTDANGIVVITEVRPITVVFSIPQEALPGVLARAEPAAGRARGASPIVVQAIDRDGRTVLDTGRLLAIDNQIDPATGTVRLKAIFGNAGGRLFPNQFVNVRMVIDRIEHALTIPASAVQRGAAGTFVFAVTPRKTASVRKVELGPPAPGERVVVKSGLAEGEPVVVDGADKLRDGAPVTAVQIPAAPAPGGANGPRRGPPAARGGATPATRSAHGE